MNGARIEKTGPGRFSVAGALTFATILQAWREAEALFDEAPSWTVDLSRVTHSDSAGLAFLIEWMREARRRRRGIRLRGAPSQMLEIARASRLDEVLPLAGTGTGEEPAVRPNP